MSPWTRGNARAHCLGQGKRLLRTRKIFSAQQDPRGHPRPSTVEVPSGVAQEISPSHPSQLTLITPQRITRAGCFFCTMRSFFQCPNEGRVLATNRACALFFQDPLAKVLRHKQALHACSIRLYSKNPSCQV